MEEKELSRSGAPRVRRTLAYTPLPYGEAVALLSPLLPAGCRFHILTFGCQQNEADSEKLGGMLTEIGYTHTDVPEEADLILLNTCSVREHAENRALSILGSFKKWKEQDRGRILGVCGCMAARPERTEQIRSSYPYVDFTMPAGDLSVLPSLILHTLRHGKRQFLPAEERAPLPEGLPTARAFRHRAAVPVMAGCNNFCSYCIVPYVRGRERSRESDQVTAEVRALVQSGCRDILLLGQNVNSYHSDCDFRGLLDKLDAIGGDYLLRFMSSHPKDVPDSLIDAFRTLRHLEPHFHLPVQAGSDRVLREMNRHYGREQYLSIAAALRQANPDIVLTSDVMVGFPGETEEDFADTLDMLRTVRFDMVYSFIYSPRPGTPAAAREDQVPPEIKKERMARLLAMQDGIALQKNQALVGQDVRVLTDRVQDGMADGRTAGGKLVHYPAAPEDVGQFVHVLIEKAEPYALIGQRKEANT